jgi:hypothetical protein
MSVSIRGGKLVPSSKYKPAASFEWTQTQWRPGVDETVFESTYQRQTRDIAENERSIVPFPRIDKNASDAGAIFGDARVPSDVHFQTENRTEFNKRFSVNADSYSKRGPADGFDRATANRTNYDLGMPGEQGDWCSSTHGLQQIRAEKGHYPESVEMPAQPNIGGWMTGPGGSYFKDIETYQNINRGGGGGEGNLGVEFNILTNAADHKARANTLARTGHRISQDRASNHQRFPSGKDRMEVDIITGKPKVQYRAPVAPTAEDLMKPNVPVLVTRPW